MPILNIKPHPFKQKHFQAEIPEGCTLHQLLPKDRSYFSVHVNGRSFDDLAPLGKGDIVDIAVTPKGTGSREGNTQKAINTGLTILGTALGTVISGGNFAAGLALGGALAGLQLAAGAIAPNPTLGRSQQEFNRLGSLTGSKNQVTPYRVIPKIYGHRKIYPCIAGKPFTEIVGNQQYLRVLYCLGYGPMEVHNPKIGDTVIGSFTHSAVAGVHRNVFNSNGNVEDVEISVGTNPALYTNDVSETVPGGSFNAENDQFVETTSIDTDEINTTITFPNGLYKNDNGKTKSAEAQFSVEFRVVGATEWLDALDDANLVRTPQKINCTIEQNAGLNHLVSSNAARETHRIGIQFRTNQREQYEVRVTRVADNTTGDAGNISNDSVWTSLQSVTYTDPINTENIVYLALRVKASDTIQGVLDNFSVEVKTKLSTYNGTSWESTLVQSTGNGFGTVTSNPAWIVADILSGNANSGALDKSRLDAAAFKTWADNCTTENRECNLVVDSGITVHELIKESASYGYADVNIVDGIYTVVEDKAFSTPVQHFTPRNTMNFRASRVFPDVPHALKVRFINPAKDWQQDEAIVYDDNYSEDGTNCLFGSGTCKTATKFETVDYLGITSWDQAWKTGRYMLAEMRLRPEIYTLDVDFEHLIANRGDLVKVTHDVPLWGSGYGRVKSVTRNGSNEVTAVTLDDVVTIDGTSNYVLRVRGDDGTSHELTVAAMSAGEYNQIDITPEVAAIAAGDLYMFGELGSETTNLKIASIEAKNDLEATLTLVDDAPEIYTADDGTIPAFNSNLTTPVDLSSLVPPDPVINDIRSATDVLYQDNDRSKRLSMVIDFSAAKGFPSLQVEAQARVNGSTGSWRLTEIVDASDGVVSLINVEQGQTYEVRIRAKNNTKVSDWVTTTHTVIGKGEAPNDVSGYSVSVDKSQIRHRWNENTDTDIEEYEIRIGGTGWDNATLVDRTKGTTLTTSIPGSGDFTYRIKAIDTSGNYSANAVTDTVTVDEKYTQEPVFSDDYLEIQSDVIENYLSVEALWDDKVSRGQTLQMLAGDGVVIDDEAARLMDSDLSWNISARVAGVLGISAEDIVLNFSNPLYNNAGSLDIYDHGSGQPGIVNTGAQTFYGAKTFDAAALFSNNVTISGDLIVNGSQVIQNVETVEVEDNIMLLNKGESGSGVTAGSSGMRVDRGTESDFLFVFDEVRDRFVLGQATDETAPSIAALQVSATIQDNPDSGGIPYYNGTANRLDTSANLLFDGTKFTVSDDFYLESSVFTGTGFTDSGVQIKRVDGLWRLVLDDAIFRGAVYLNELIVNQISSLNGSEILSPGRGKIESVSGSSPTETVVTSDPQGGNFASFKANDICLCQQVRPNDNQLVKRIVRQVDTVSGNSVTFKAHSGAPADAGSLAKGDLIVAIGNTTDATRQSIIWRSVTETGGPIIEIKTGIDSWTAWLDQSNIPYRAGYMDDFTFNGQNLSGYGAFFKDNLYVEFAGGLGYFGKGADGADDDGLYFDANNYWLANSGFKAQVLGDDLETAVQELRSDLIELYLSSEGAYSGIQFLAGQVILTTNVDGKLATQRLDSTGDESLIQLVADNYLLETDDLLIDSQAQRILMANNQAALTDPYNNSYTGFFLDFDGTDFTWILGDTDADHIRFDELNGLQLNDLAKFGLIAGDFADNGDGYGDGIGLKNPETAGDAVFWAGSSEQDPSLVTPSNSLFVLYDDGNIVHPAIGGPLTVPTKQQSFGTTTSNVGAFSGAWDTPATTTTTTPTTSTAKVKIYRYKKEFGMNKITLTVMARRTIDSYVGSVHNAEIRLIVNGVPQSVEITNSTYNQYSIEADISALTLGAFYDVEIQNYAEVTSNGSDLAETRVYLREDFVLSDSTEPV